MAAHLAFGQHQAVHAQIDQSLGHDGPTGQQAQHRRTVPCLVAERLQQCEHATALGHQRASGCMVGTDGFAHGGVVRQRLQVQFRVAAGQVERMGDGRHRLVGQRREETQLRAQRAQGVEIGRVDERKGSVVRNGDDGAGQRTGQPCPVRSASDRGAGGLLRRLEDHVGRHRQQPDGAQGSGGGLDAFGQIVYFRSLHQPQVTRRQPVLPAARQCATPSHACGQAFLQHLRMARAADTVGQHAGQAQAGTVGGQPVRHGAEGLRHGRRIDHHQQRQIESQGQIGARRRAVVQAHHAFDQYHVGLLGRAVEQLRTVRLATHPQVELLYRRAAGALEDHRIEKVGAGLEHAHTPPLAAMPVCQGSGDCGLALPRGRGRDHQRRATHGSAWRRGSKRLGREISNDETPR